MKAPKAIKPPPKWKEQYNALQAFRKTFQAPVDTIGCDRLMIKEAPASIQRFHILLSLLLSSQTKDEVTAAAMNTLHTRLGHPSTGITIQHVLDASISDIDACICKVGFHRKKAQYMHQVASILRQEHQGDVPDDLQTLLSLPGIGPKMAYLFLQAAYNRNDGIGVDTHVHRISKRLGWTSAAVHAKGPESTRQALEAWLPSAYWGEVNTLLVGMGQTVCAPIKPKCQDCALNALCPSSTAKPPRKIRDD
jgi:endonuclease-3